MFDQQNQTDYSDRTAAALASIERDRLRRHGESQGAVFAAVAFGDAMRTTPLGRAAMAAEAFCIIAAGVIPVVLFWTLVYPG